MQKFNLKMDYKCFKIICDSEIEKMIAETIFYNHYNNFTDKSKQKALLDLAFLADKNNNELEIQMVQLAKRWDWTTTKTFNFIDKLIKLKIIKKQSFKRYVIIKFRLNNL